MPRSSWKAARSALPRTAPPGRAVLALVAVLVGMLAAAERAHARPAMRGVQLHSLWWGSTDAEMDRELDLAAQAHSTAVRVDVAWGSLEPTAKGQLSTTYTARLDRFVAGARARGMLVIATLWGSPCWSSTAPDSLKQGCADGWWGRGVAAYPPADPADYGDAARWMTARYGTDLAALEIWNEPNGWAGNSPFWKAADKPGAYAALVRAAYPAARAGNPSVPVLAGALAGSDRAFLEALYAAGIKGFYDGLSSHPYADPGFTRLSELHAAQLAAGDSTPVWATEFGYPTGAGPEWHVTEAEQATHLLRDFADLDTLDWVVGAIIYDLRNDGTDPGNMEDNFGLLYRDFTPKPGYHAAGMGLAGNYSPGTSAAATPLRSAITAAASAVLTTAAPRRPHDLRRPGACRIPRAAAGCFEVPASGRLSASRLRVVARVARAGSTLRAYAFADLGPTPTRRAGGQQLIGTATMRRVKAGRVKLTIRFTPYARRVLRRQRRATVRLRLSLAPPQGPTLSITRRVKLRRW